MKFIPVRHFIVSFAAVAFLVVFGTHRQANSRLDEISHAYLGFDRNIYPGDVALPVLRKTFTFTSYWLSPPPGEKTNTWLGKRKLLHLQGFGFVVLYRGRDSREFKKTADATQKGAIDASNAATAAKNERFTRGTIIFLDIEEGGRLPLLYHAYLRAWADALVETGYRSGVYCSGMRVDEGGGVSIITPDDIRNNIGAREIVYWVYNDACPPSPGCSTQQNPPPPSASGISYAAIWQFAQSPHRREFTKRCAFTYQADGNCYAPGDTTHAWHLDINTATSPDPSAGMR
jgi:glycoside hydrolase-like protein